MKLSTIAKTSLALGILTTGVMTTHAQSADAAVEQKSSDSQNVESLLAYYKNGHELKNVKGTKDGDKVSITDKSVLTEVKLVGKDRLTIEDKDLSNLDVFVVRENNISREATNVSIGGITKPNQPNYIDYVTKVPFTVKSTSNGWNIENNLGVHEIKKEEISLKELDFKLRKKLIDEKLIYTNGKKDGVIVVKMKGQDENDKYSFELNKKLQDHRMGDVIDSRKIEKITVDLK
ncbi:exotoxin beta-grasp domain-containing protein [Staphylococcus agnetis]|uniref:Superantigen-like protein n=1 Tax=Staphylococcus agnetis TaxID=985762 RepID=A0ABX3Z2X3_9STAP|nr:hypothetical protein [Staphylococcus agnetis]ALN77589.1 superantigen-like protein [Staphylococcus agnetis]OSP21990.1 hypothetical protein B9L42_02105 [Staphylococcus agnetis]OSP22473.1 hypothetical protein B9M87_11715 [Staphylococcus agnetis]OTW31240.1 hypothetical protein B9M88_04715 [Staphylococcus agnetis]